MSCSTMGNGIPIPCTTTYEKSTGQSLCNDRQQESPAFRHGECQRKQWLEANKGFHGIYFCMYCGRPMTSKTLTIDHIFPCDRSSKSLLLQFIISKTGIYDINDIRNLGPCCRHCNSKKGSKVNLYYMLAACLGKRPYGFIIRWSIRLLIFIILVFVLIGWTIIIFHYLNVS